MHWTCIFFAGLWRILAVGLVSAQWNEDWLQAPTLRLFQMIYIHRDSYRRYERDGLPKRKSNVRPALSSEWDACCCAVAHTCTPSNTASAHRCTGSGANTARDLDTGTHNHFGACTSNKTPATFKHTCQHGPCCTLRTWPCALQTVCIFLVWLAVHAFDETGLAVGCTSQHFWGGNLQTAQVQVICSAAATVHCTQA